MRFWVALFSILLLGPSLAMAARRPPPPPVEVALRWKAGTVLYQTAATAKLERVNDVHVVAKDALVSTGPSSIGVLEYPEKSLVALGQNTTLQVGAFHAKGSQSSATIRIPPTGGSVRFDVRHAEGGESRYVFTTSLAEVTVRGTSALLSDGISGDTLICLVCEAGDVVARLRGRDFALLSGETMRITPAGRVSIEKTSDEFLMTFADTGLSVQPPPPEPKPTPRRFHLKLKL